MIGDRRGGRLVGWGASITAVLLEGSLQNNTELKTMGLMEGWKIRKVRCIELEEAGRNHPLQQLLPDMYGDTITVNDAVKRRAQYRRGTVWSGTAAPAELPMRFLPVLGYARLKPKSGQPMT